jgi:hypothetical protein
VCADPPVRSQVAEASPRLLSCSAFRGRAPSAIPVLDSPGRGPGEGPQVGLFTLWLSCELDGAATPQAPQLQQISVSVHVSNLLAKLGVAVRVEAAAIAHRLGLD